MRKHKSPLATEAPQSWLVARFGTNKVHSTVECTFAGKEIHHSLLQIDHEITARFVAPPESNAAEWFWAFSRTSHCPALSPFLTSQSHSIQKTQCFRTLEALSLDKEKRSAPFFTTRTCLVSHSTSTDFFSSQNRSLHGKENSHLSTKRTEWMKALLMRFENVWS